jgi:glyoxylase-like metal-dependent hydrolase (beta-lactamase superfamily II)
VTKETTFADYGAAGNLQLPARITSSLDGLPMLTLQVKTNTVNGETGDLAAPADARSAAPPPPPTVTAEELAPGVWYLAGQSHHSVLLEFGDHLTLVEAPQSDARTLAVIAKARELRPDKPLTHVINTHHHFDHSGGVRAAVSEGLAIITHERNRTFYTDIVARPHTLRPDALAKNAEPLKIEAVTSELALKDGMREAVVYPITDSAHADTLLMVYLPKERLLIEADVYSPPAPNAAPPPAFPFAENLLQNIRSRNLQVERLVPIHGRVVPLGDLEAVVKPAATTAP